MKHSLKNKKHPTQPQRPAAAAPAKPSLTRWAVLGLGLVLGAGGSWAFMEFIIWNRLPGELVGAWEVTQGPPEYKDAVFEFYRNGSMVGHLNYDGKLEIMQADVRLEENRLYLTTRSPHTGKERVSVQTIRKLSDGELVVADKRGQIMKMKRIP